MSRLWGAAAMMDSSGGGSLSASISPTFWMDSYFIWPVSENFQVTASGGTGNYTYSWSRSGLSTLNTTLSPTNTNNSTLSLNAEGQYDGTVSCQVNDGQNTVTVNASISVTIGSVE